MGILLRLTVERNVVKDSSPVLTAVLEVDRRLIHPEAIAAGVLHFHYRIAPRDTEDIPDVLAVVPQRVTDHLALVRIGASARRIETVRGTLSTADVICSLRQAALLSGTVPGAGDVGAGVGYHLDVLVLSYIGLGEYRGVLAKRAYVVGDGERRGSEDGREGIGGEEESLSNTDDDGTHGG